MSEEDSRREPVEANVVHEAEEVPQPQPEPPVRRPLPIVRRRKPFFNLTTMLVLLVLVGAAAFLLRGQLTDTYDRYIGGETPEPSTDEVAAPSQQSQTQSEAGDQSDASDDYDVKMPPPPRKIEDDERDVVAPPIHTYQPDEGPPGLAYSIVDRRDRGYGNVSRWEMKVVIPKDASREDILRCARDIVRVESKQRVYHALQLYFFDTPGDPDDLDPQNAVARVVWAPQGKFGLAERALTQSTQINQFKVTMKP